MRKLLRGMIPLFAVVFLYANNLTAATVVKVGGYVFPPFVEKAADGKFYGLTIDMINALNRVQDVYEFKFVFTSPRRKYRKFQSKSYDMLFFESIDWGWKKQSVEPTKVFLKGGDVFIALKETAKSQDYFNSFKNKSMAGMLGYHYSFAQFNADPKFLKSNYNMHLTNKPDTNIRLVLKGQRDIAIVTKSYLHKFLDTRSSAKSRLIISKNFDQEYNHTILVRKNSTPSVLTMNFLLDELVKKGEMKKIIEKNGITN